MDEWLGTQWLIQGISTVYLETKVRWIRVSVVELIFRLLGRSWNWESSSHYYIKLNLELKTLEQWIT